MMGSQLQHVGWWCPEGEGHLYFEDLNERCAKARADGHLQPVFRLVAALRVLDDGEYIPNDRGEPVWCPGT